MERKYQNSLKGSLGIMVSRTITLALDSWTYEFHILGTQLFVMAIDLGQRLWSGGWVSQRVLTKIPQLCLQKVI